MTNLRMDNRDDLDGEALPLSIAVWQEGRILYLSPCGEIDLHTVSVLQEAITNGLKDGRCTDIVADMSQVPFVDSTGYGVLLNAMQMLQARGTGRIHLVRCHPAVSRMLTVARLNRVFAVHETLEGVRDLICGSANS